jgi:hypothetical protein
MLTRCRGGVRSANYTQKTAGHRKAFSTDGECRQPCERKEARVLAASLEVQTTPLL